jgi:RNA polymerase sigma-70 factor (sigma-E family)
MSSRPDSDFIEYVSGQLTRLHRIAYFMCGDSSRADDLIQATMVSLYAAWPSARKAENLDGYVHRILVRRFLDEKRSAWSRVLFRDRLPEMVEDRADGVVERSAMVGALRRLPAGQRAVIVLRYYSDLSVEQTAAALGCSTGNVKSQCAKGLANLRLLLAADGEQSQPPAARRPRQRQPVARISGGEA